MSELTSQIARNLISVAEEKAHLLGINVSIAITDKGAHLLEFRRMDGAILGSGDVAMRKARTATLFPMPTGDFGQLINQAALNGMELSNGGLAAFPGGVPIKLDETLVGAIGISGGTAEKDLEIAEYALDKAGCGQ